MIVMVMTMMMLLLLMVLSIYFNREMERLFAYHVIICGWFHGSDQRYKCFFEGIDWMVVIYLMFHTA